MFIFLCCFILNLPSISNYNHSITYYRKVELLTSEDLQLEWRPLYKVLDKVMYGPGDNYALTLYPA